MAKKTALLMPATDALLQRFGERLGLARRRRRLSSKQVAERAGMAPMTLRSLERGGSGVTIGAYLSVMQVLGIERDLDMLGQADPLGRELQDSRLPAGRTAVAASRAGVKPPFEVDGPKPEGDAIAWIGDSNFTNSRALADLLEPKAPAPKKRHG